jgi:hypothetical protein
MKRFSAFVVLGLLLLHSAFATAHAEGTSLQQAPLIYRASLHAGSPQRGHIKVSNPTDAAITVQSQVQAIHQSGNQGELIFYDAPSLLPAITLSHEKVTINAHKSVDFNFLINPDKLPAGGVYAAIFFRTIPQTAAKSNAIQNSVRIGTLLLLQNGTTATAKGRITDFHVPWLTYGSRVNGTITYLNTGSLALNPNLMLHAGFTSPQTITGPYILPASLRIFPVEITGNHLGLIHITVDGSNPQTTSSRWLIAITGFWQWLLPILLLATILSLLFVRYRNQFIYGLK